MKDASTGWFLSGVAKTNSLGKVKNVGVFDGIPLPSPLLV
jgi:hypothetical protein